MCHFSSYAYQRYNVSNQFLSYTSKYATPTVGQIHP
jgi:hypothetical protein